MPGRVRKIEYVSLAGLRLDGRKPGDPRELEIELGSFRDGCDGSAFVAAGGTKVVAAIYGPKEMPGVMGDKCQITVSCEYAAYASSSGHRKRADIRQQEAVDAVKGILDDQVMRSQFPNSALQVHIEILADDGSAIPAMINATSVALCHAGVPIKDIVTACSASLLQGHVLVDVSDQEARATGPCLHLAVYPSTGNISLMTVDYQMELDDLNAMMEQATKGCTKLHAEVKRFITEATEEQFKTRAREK